MKVNQIIKSSLDESAETFKNDILLNENRIDILKELGNKNNFNTKKVLRPLAWKIFLGVIPSESTENNILKEWIDIIFSQREEFKKKIEKYCSIKKMGLNDPLLQNDGKNDLIYNQEEKNVLNLIDLDLQRTHQTLELFHLPKTKNILSNVLFVYAKEYWGDVPYGQGMNELLSMIYICLYPYYFNDKDYMKEKITKEKLYEYLNDINKYYKEIYLFFHDENEIQSDLYYLFEALEKKGINDLYERIDIKKNDPNYNLYELFPDIIKDHFDEERTNHLYNHLKRTNVKCNYYMHRWLKCIFSREFEINNVLCLWDKIFFYEFNSSEKYKYSLVYIDFICVAMLMNIRYELISKDDESDCYTLIFHYPTLDNISTILEISEKVSEIIEQKLKGETYDINDVLRLIKRNGNFIENDEDNYSDTNEELIIKPHMYNQKNNLSFISCDQNKEKIIFCGKYYVKTKVLMIFILFLIIGIILIYLFNKYRVDNS